MSDVSTTLGVFPDFTWTQPAAAPGQQPVVHAWKIARRKFRTEALVEAALKGKSRDDLVALWGGHPLLEANLRVFQQDCAAEQYAFGGLVYQAAMATLAGLKTRTFFDLAQENRQVTRDLVEAVAADETPLPTGRVDDQGGPVTETYFGRLLAAIREANAPLAPPTPPPAGAGPSPSPSSPPPSPASPG